RDVRLLVARHLSGGRRTRFGPAGGACRMLIDLRAEPDAAREPADICIVGAGAAGITLARRLAGQGLAVCLLESGGLDFEQATQDLYKGANLGMPYYDLDESRLRF